MKFVCDSCGYEFELDDFPDEEFKCPGCESEECSFSLLE
ncbi:MAG: rubredoxin [Promethearchaeota archaeon]